MGVFDFLKGGKKEEGEGIGGEFDFEPSSSVGGPSGGKERRSSRGRGGGPPGPGGTDFGPPSGTKGGEGGGLPSGGSQRREGPPGPGGSFGPPGGGGVPQGPSERTGRGGPTGPSRGSGMGGPREQRPGTGRSMAPPTPGQGKGVGQQDLKRTMHRVLGKLDEMNRTLKNIQRELGRR